ncbi:MAG: hypothetical protein AAFY60_05915, partial [Myxococcota bacterium]
MASHDSLTVIVFAKPPKPGKTKTRLAKRIGNDDAVRFATAFVRDSLEQLDRFQNIERVLATTETWPELEIPVPDGMEIWQQGPG